MFPLQSYMEAEAMSNKPNTLRIVGPSRDRRLAEGECNGHFGDFWSLIVYPRKSVVTAVRSALEDERDASKLRGRSDEMEPRLRVIESRAEGKREVALNAMFEAGLRHLEAPCLSIYLRQAPSLLVIGDEGLVPDTYRLAVPSRIDYQAIREALKGGAEVPEAALAESEPYLSVRTS